MTVVTSIAKTAQSGKYLTFLLGQQEYGLEILSVYQVNSTAGLARDPKAPPFIRGVINQYGLDVPVADLRPRLGLHPVEDGAKTSIIVVKIPHQVAEVTLGLVVDEVVEVVSLGEKQIQTAAPGPHAGADAPGVLGTGRLGARKITLLDAEMLLTDEELAALSRMDQVAPAGRRTTGGTR